MYQLQDDLIEDDLETIHMYVSREPVRMRRPGTSLRLLRACLRLLLLAASGFGLWFVPGQPPLDNIQTISVPARLLPLVSFAAVSAIVPTGTKTYPATVAHGTLTLYNGSILTQQLPAGLIVMSAGSVEIVTDSSVSIPPANPPSYGMAIVAAHTATPGQTANIAAYAVSAVYGADVYLKNLTAFTGGVDAQTISYATQQDEQAALMRARQDLSTQEHRHSGLLASACQEGIALAALRLSVQWACQFVTFTPPPGVRVLSVRLSGRSVVLEVRWLGVA